MDSPREGGNLSVELILSLARSAGKSVWGYIEAIGGRFIAGRKLRSVASCQTSQQGRGRRQCLVGSRHGQIGRNYRFWVDMRRGVLMAIDYTRNEGAREGGSGVASSSVDKRGAGPA